MLHCRNSGLNIQILHILLNLNSRLVSSKGFPLMGGTKPYQHLLGVPIFRGSKAISYLIPKVALTTIRRGMIGDRGPTARRLQTLIARAPQLQPSKLEGTKRSILPQFAATARHRYFTKGENWFEIEGNLILRETAAPISARRGTVARRLDRAGHFSDRETAFSRLHFAGNSNAKNGIRKRLQRKMEISLGTVCPNS